MPEFIYTDPNAPMMTETEGFSAYEMFKGALEGSDVQNQTAAIALGTAFLVAARGLEEMSEPGEIDDNPALKGFLGIVWDLAETLENNLLMEALEGLFEGINPEMSN